MKLINCNTGDTIEICVFKEMKHGVRSEDGRFFHWDCWQPVEEAKA